jgi:hypothetical protein
MIANARGPKPPIRPILRSSAGLQGVSGTPGLIRVQPIPPPTRPVRWAINFDRLPRGAQVELERQGWVPTHKDYR